VLSGVGVLSESGVLSSPSNPSASPCHPLFLALPGPLAGESGAANCMPRAQAQTRRGSGGGLFVPRSSARRASGPGTRQEGWRRWERLSALEARQRRVRSQDSLGHEGPVRDARVLLLPRQVQDLVPALEGTSARSRGKLLGRSARAYTVQPARPWGAWCATQSGLPQGKWPNAKRGIFMGQEGEREPRGTSHLEAVHQLPRCRRRTAPRSPPAGTPCT